MIMFKENGVSREYFAEDIPVLESRELDLTEDYIISNR
jgi:hypothetical protein